MAECNESATFPDRLADASEIDGTQRFAFFAVYDSRRLGSVSDPAHRASAVGRIDTVVKTGATRSIVAVADFACF